jgi:UDP-N-acetylmuramoyl-L-alanyl-D-glutamate--2,6-diaminopimelate ligase
LVIHTLFLPLRTTKNEKRIAFMGFTLMLLSQLIHDALGQPITSSITVTSIAQDHRKIQARSLFIARAGASFDGHTFVQTAVDAGAVAVVGEKDRSEISLQENIPYIQVVDSRRAVAKLAATFYGHPSRSLITFGVTGTDGKTTTSFLLHHLLSSKYKVGLLSTAAIKVGEKTLDLEGHFTTPEATEVQKYLALFRDEGCTHAVIESSSHGFALHRLDGVKYDFGIWTNLYPEHLDFHKTFEAYREAKLELMRRASMCVLNRDDENFEYFLKAAGENSPFQIHKHSSANDPQDLEGGRRKGEGGQKTSPPLTYGRHPDSDWQLLNIKAHPGEQIFTVKIRSVREDDNSLKLSPDKSVTVAPRLPMVGAYNVHNALAALIAAHEAGVMVNDLFNKLGSFTGVPGRMEVVQREPFALIVDFAHTPPALENMLSVLRPVTRGKLIVVVGAAGERDPGKREPLGEMAVKLADLAIFTEEDSRSEDVNLILGEMARGAIKAGGEATKSYWCIADRREAIRFAVSQAQEGDTIVLAGKGHEATLERMSETLAWDEVAEARRVLEKRF